MSHVDVLVVGAGVAGSTAAIGLARHGLDVMLVDRAKFPRHKVCGCCLNSEAGQVLDDLGLGKSLQQIGATPIDRIEIYSHNRSVSLASKGGFAVSRYALDAMLHDVAKQSGCVVLDQTTARITQTTEQVAAVPVHHAQPGLNRRATIQAKVVIVADGLAGSCTSGIEEAKRKVQPNSLRGYGAQLPADQHTAAPGQVAMHCGRGGYVGTVVLEDGSLDIAAAMKSHWVKAHRSPSRVVEAIMMQSGLALSGLHSLSWRATAPLTGHRQKLWMPRVFFLGDSAGYVEPFTGEGMAWAMRSARALEPIVLQALECWDARLGTDWEHAYRCAVQRRQWRCRLFARLLRQPRLVASMISLAGLLPVSAIQTGAGALLPPMFRTTGPIHLKELANP